MEAPGGRRYGVRGHDHWQPNNSHKGESVGHLGWDSLFSHLQNINTPIVLTSITASRTSSRRRKGGRSLSRVHPQPVGLVLQQEQGSAQLHADEERLHAGDELQQEHQEKQNEVYKRGGGGEKHLDQCDQIGRFFALWATF